MLTFIAKSYFAYTYSIRPFSCMPTFCEPDRLVHTRTHNQLSTYVRRRQRRAEWVGGWVQTLLTLVQFYSPRTSEKHPETFLRMKTHLLAQIATVCSRLDPLHWWLVPRHREFFVMPSLGESLTFLVEGRMTTLLEQISLQLEKKHGTMSEKGAKGPR